MKTFKVLDLDTRRAKADSTYPVLLRIIHYGKSSAIQPVFILEKKTGIQKDALSSLPTVELNQ
jgi:hypothetical protein